MITIILRTSVKREEVVSFIQELKDTINSESFNIDTDFIMIVKSKQKDMEHSTQYTLLDLECDVHDVIDVLKELTVSDYSECRIDKDDLDPPRLFIFGKIINRKTVYIKLKIKEKDNKCIVCVSFHYAKEKMSFPYA